MREVKTFIIFLGCVSLLSDMTYEGARSIIGPFLASLGATGSIVGFVSGLGELLGYVVRLPFGWIADRTGRYWGLTILGYLINLLSVPALALVGQWQVAVLLIMGERTGKAIRTPARDAMLSHAAAEIGRGWAFGFHEAMDQIGAMLGPLIVAVILHWGGGYRKAFAVLFLPALLALSVLVLARFLYPSPRQLESHNVHIETRGLGRAYWVYLVGVALIGAGYADFPLIAYHLKRVGVFSEQWIPVFYAWAMGVDALSALFFGHLFDKRGPSILLISVVLSAGFAPLSFFGGLYLGLLGITLWGIGMGAQESVMRAAVALLVPKEKRGVGYGLFNTGYGLFWFVGSTILGMLYDSSIPALVVFSVLLQLSSIPFLLFFQSLLSSPPGPLEGLKAPSQAKRSERRQPERVLKD
jgi:MFS family permease